jgi:hypothetical protein
MLNATRTRFQGNYIDELSLFILDEGLRPGFPEESGEVPNPLALHDPSHSLAITQADGDASAGNTTLIDPILKVAPVASGLTIASSTRRHRGKSSGASRPWCSTSPTTRTRSEALRPGSPPERPGFSPLRGPMVRDRPFPLLHRPHRRSWPGRSRSRSRRSNRSRCRRSESSGGRVY